jgi:hypothetical protein
VGFVKLGKWQRQQRLPAAQAHRGIGFVSSEAKHPGIGSTKRKADHGIVNEVFFRQFN